MTNEPLNFFLILFSSVYEIYVTRDRISFLHDVVLGTSLEMLSFFCSLIVQMCVG